MRLEEVSDFGGRRSDGGEMGEGRDPAIKLFGRTIPLPESQPPLEEAAVSGSPSVLERADDEKDIFKETTNAGAQDSTDATEDPEQCEPNCPSSLNRSDEDNRRASTQNDKATSDPKPEQDETEPGHKKTLKKPDKIVPCPRCNSLETKFCYYNNYNVNQPRHFCKNCQRYWTAGGTMRNVPVGAGRRKSKHSASHYRPVMALANEPESAQFDAPNLAHHQALPSEPLKGNCSELKFGPEAPLCESISSVLNLREQREEPPSASSPAAENGSHIEQESTQGYCNGVSPIQHLPCYAAPPWVYPWGPGWNNGIPSPVPWNGQPLIAAPAFCAPTVPFPLVPASIWGSMPGWSNGPWAVPWIGASGVMSPTSSTSNSGCSGDGSPKLGKHLRDTNSQVDEKRERSLWVPKTLRIDDPDEAAKSSIWATLGIKPDDDRGNFKAFQSKRSGERPKSDIEQAMHSNPAAFSRSQTFQEST